MRSVATSPAPSNESRNRRIRAIQAACRSKGIDKDARHEIQAAVIGKASITDMNDAELGKLLDHLNRGKSPSPGRGPHAGKIRALWWSLFWLAEVDDPNDRAIDGFVRRQTGIAALRFLDHRSAPKVIEGLKARLERAGVTWPKDPGEFGDRRAVAEAIFAQLGIKGFKMAGYVAVQIHMTSASSFWTAQHWDAAIRFLGKQNRRRLGKTIATTPENGQ